MAGIEIGLKGRYDEIVTENKTAAVVGSGALEVYSTPFMVAMMENASFNSLKPYLEDGQNSVGSMLNIQHLSPSPVGIKVWAESIVTAVDGRRITFDVAAYDEKGLIGKGTHERFIIDTERFMAKCCAKKD